MATGIDRIKSIFDDGGDAQGKPQSKGNAGLTFMMIALLLVTGYFTWDYLYSEMRDKQFGMVVALAGLAAFDLGALLWSRVWKSNSSNETQDGIARGMFVVDIVGMLLTTLGDSVPADKMPQILGDLTPIIIGVVIVLNVVAKFEYDNQSDAVKHAREWRKGQAEINSMTVRSNLELERQRMSIQAKRAALEQQELLAAQEQEIDQAELRLQATKAGAARARVTGEHIEKGKQAVQGKVIGDFSKWADSVKSVVNGNGNGHNNGNGATAKAATVEPIVIPSEPSPKA